MSPALRGSSLPIEACYQRLGEWVVAQRLKAGLTQQAVADLMAISRPSLANIEAGRQRVMLHQAEQLRELLSDEALAEHIRAAEDKLLAQADAIRKRRAVEVQP